MINPAIIEPNSENSVKKYTANFVQHGRGTPVILIHGLAASLYDWNELIPALTASSFSVYALDLLGHGESGKPESLNDYTVDNVFSHFSEWLNSLQLKTPFILIGHSLGGYLALQYAQRCPEQVRALVLVDPFFSIKQLPLLLRINYRRPLITTTMIERTPEWLFRGVIDLTSLSIRNGHILPASVRMQTAADYKRAHPGIFNIIHSIHDFTPNFASIHQPTLVLWGARDQTLAPAFFSKAIQQIPHATGEAIRGAGHVPHQSHPAEFNRKVMNFLNNLKNH